MWSDKNCFVIAWLSLYSQEVSKSGIQWIVRSCISSPDHWIQCKFILSHCLRYFLRFLIVYCIEIQQKVCRRGGVRMRPSCCPWGLARGLRYNVYGLSLHILFFLVFMCSAEKYHCSLDSFLFDFILALQSTIGAWVWRNRYSMIWLSALNAGTEDTLMYPWIIILMYGIIYCIWTITYMSVPTQSLKDSTCISYFIFRLASTKGVKRNKMYQFFVYWERRGLKFYFWWIFSFPVLIWNVLYDVIL